MFLKRTIQAVFAACLCFGGAASAQTPYLHQMKSAYPAAFALWTKSLPVMAMPDWMKNFNGPASPIRDITIGGARMKFGTACMPHDCGDNIVGVLFSPGQDKVMGVAKFATSGPYPAVMLIGAMTNAEFQCIRKLTTEHNATSC